MIDYLSLFSGIGAFEKAMKNLEIPFNLVGFSEIDKYATKSYCEIHNVSESLNLGDITKIDGTKLPKVDFITYGFPCQDTSLAGQQKGLFNADGTKTRSGLFFDALRIIEHTQPVVAIAENVKNLTSKKFNAQFQVVLTSLESAGYNNYWAILNAKDFGIPQNRERVFIVSIRKDVDTGVFEFPKGYELKLRLKDLLEDEVDEKFYVADDKIKPLLNRVYEVGSHPFNTMEDGTCRTIKNQYYKNSQANFIKQTDQGATAVLHVDDTKHPIRLGGIYDTGTSKHQAGSVWDKNGIAPTIDTMQGGSRQPLVVMNVGNVNPSGKGQNGSVVDSDGLARTITQEKGEGQKVLVHSPLRIRKLTPKECFRLMGFEDEDFEKCPCSNTQLYKQAGNSIVVDVAEELLCMLFDEDGKFFI